MDPISNQIFAHDFEKSVLQDPNIRNTYTYVSVKPFEPIEKTSKTKKDLDKEKK